MLLMQRENNFCTKHYIFDNKFCEKNRDKEKRVNMIQRARRLRQNEILRKMVRETRMDKSSLVYPMFVREGENIVEEIPSMEGQFRYSVKYIHTYTHLL